MFPRILVAMLVLGTAAPVAAQVDPLLFLKSTKPNVILVVDTSARMQRGTPWDPTDQKSSVETSNYYDPVPYPVTNSPAEATLGVAANQFYRRLYTGFAYR